MMEEAAWYLLAKNEEGKICGFSHFRYDMDCDDEVLYVYEVRTYHYKSDPKFSLNSKMIEKNLQKIFHIILPILLLLGLKQKGIPAY